MKAYILRKESRTKELIRTVLNIAAIFATMLQCWKLQFTELSFELSP